MNAAFKTQFPLLTDIESKQTSPVDTRYNCIAWAFKDNRRWWWPIRDPRCYWPTDVSGRTALEAFEDWFDADEWEKTDASEFEEGFDKVALYTKDGEPTHAARMLENGFWSSKLGNNLDLSHSTNCLDGPEYGKIHSIYKKKT